MMVVRARPQRPLVPMRRRDLAAVTAIDQRSSPHPWTAAMVRDEFHRCRTGDRVYVVARDPGVVGFAGMMVVGDEAHVTNIAVDPDHRRRGWARRLLGELCWRAIERGVVAMTLEVRVSNDAARALYESLGFVTEGVRRRYYENTEDALVMWLRGMDGDAFIAHLGEWVQR